MNFLFTGLCNSSGSSSFTLPLYPVFSTKKLQTILSNPFGYPSYLGFPAISKDLSFKALSEIFFLPKYVLLAYEASWAKQTLSSLFL